VHRLRPERRGGVRQHLQPCSRRTVRNGRKKDEFGVVGMEERGLICPMTEAVRPKIARVHAKRRVFRVELFQERRWRLHLAGAKLSQIKKRLFE
jgi:hypothetical protein